jgi:hypothetical protein
LHFSAPRISAALALVSSNFILIALLTANSIIFNMSLRRSQRALKPITIWEEKKAPSSALDPKLTAQTARNNPKTALEPIAVGPLPDSTKLDYKHLPKLPNYNLPLNIREKPS